MGQTGLVQLMQIPRVTLWTMQLPISYQRLNNFWLLRLLHTIIGQPTLISWKKQMFFNTKIYTPLQQFTFTVNIYCKYLRVIIFIKVIRLLNLSKKSLRWLTLLN